MAQLVNIIIHEISDKKTKEVIDSMIISKSKLDLYSDFDMTNLFLQTMDDILYQYDNSSEYYFSMKVIIEKEREGYFGFRMDECEIELIDLNKLSMFKFK